MSTTLISPGNTTLLQHISWQTYESLLKDYAGYRGVYLYFDRGKLEIMTPGPDHEYLNRTLEAAVGAIVEETDTDVTPLGSTTFKRPDIERGFEPDSCFYFVHAEEMRGRSEIDLLVDPAPELVIEVDDTSSSLDKLPLYASVGVQEVWRYKDGGITIYILDEGVYHSSENSLAFPELNREALEQFVSSARTMRRPDWLRSIRSHLRRSRGQQAQE